jgi:LPXTG-site transpeptidase (sortase) family protein
MPTVARVKGLLGGALMAAGIGLLALTAGLYGYGEYERVQFERGQAERYRIEAATATTESLRIAYETGVARGLATATAAAQPTAGAARSGGPSQTLTATAPPAGAPAPNAAAVTPTPAPPTPTPAPIVIRRIFARAISLDAEVVESKIERGEWQVPKFVAGHLQGTALPGSGGNVVLSGHVQSISSGNVFANIDKLKVGDEVTLRTTAGEVVYRIAGKNIVKNDDISVVQPTRSEELTLITCTGAFNILTQDYSHRWVVWGTRLG